MTDIPTSSQPPDNDHAWIHDHIATAVTAGLAAAEQSRFDAHINACPECFDAFTEARDADRALQRALAPLAPSAQFEQALLETLREKTMHKRFRPIIKCAGFALAASIALAATGVFAQYIMTQDTVTRSLADRQLADAKSHGITLPFLNDHRAGAAASVNMEHASTAANLRGTVQSQIVYSNESSDSHPAVTMKRTGSWDSPNLGRNGQDVAQPVNDIPDAAYDRDNELKSVREMSVFFSRDLSRANNEESKESLFAAEVNKSLPPVPSARSGPGGGPADVKAAAQLSQHGGKTGASDNAHAGLAKDGAGTWGLNGTATYTGGTTVNGGTIGGEVQKLQAADGEMTLDGGTLGGSGTLAQNGKDTLFFNRTDANQPTSHTVYGWFDQSGNALAQSEKGPNASYFQPGSVTVAAGATHGETDLYALGDAEHKIHEKSLITKDSLASQSTGQQSGGDQGKSSSATDAPLDIAVVPLTTVDATWYGDLDQKQKLAAEFKASEHGQPNAPAPLTPSVPTTNPAAPALTPPPASGQPDVQVAQRKIIRNGTVEFEVRLFDDASATITKIVTEEGGFVSSTSSEKLANGKIRGTIVVRVPPERLDRVLLELHGLGDLKSQQIAANDVTKEYTDIDSELRGLRTMEARLIDLIKNGKGEVKDLVVAEKQLGEYRVRIEKLEGDIRYYNNLVGMATLSIVAYEKDIQKPTAASEMENVALSLETEDVETKYKDARKILDDAKGRIVESELKKYDADQYSARIVVDVPPDKADFVTAQLKQIGKVANYNRDRKQTTTGGTGVPTVQVEEKDTRFVISLYNLANVAPRETAVLTLAVRDVEATYQKILSLVRQPVAAKADEKNVDLGRIPANPAGRVITSNINGQQPQQMSADIRADVRSDEADRVLQAIRDSGEILTSTSTQNADTTNTTLARRGLQLRLVNVAAVPARETRTLRVVAASVPDAYAKLVSALQDAGGGAGPADANIRIITSQLNETDPRTVTAKLSFEARREALPAVDKAFTAAGIDFLSRNIVRSNDTANTLDSKVYFQIDELLAADALAPRRTTVLGVELDNVEKSLDSLRTTLPAQTREIEYNLTKEANGRVTGRLVLETPLTNAMTVLTRIKDLGGTEKVNQIVKNTQVPDAPFARERIELTLTSREALVESGRGLGSTIRAALGSAATALLLSLYLILTGLLFAGPFLVVIWIAYRLFWRKKRIATA